MSHALAAWLSAFLVTQAIEIPIYVAVLRREAQAGRARRELGLLAWIGLAFGASALTHPVVWFVIAEIPYRSYWAMAARAELFALLSEGIYLYVLCLSDLRRALGASLLANASSFGLGLLLRALFGWP